MSEASAAGPLILVDWGTTNFRASFMHGSRLIEERQSGQGVLGVGEGGFERALLNEIGAWRMAAPGAAILMAGMVGSSRGWRTTDYVPCPADISDFALRLVRVPLSDGGRAYIVPGASFNQQGSGFDVMRGEECQAFGALKLLGAGGSEGRATLCLPGTHTKWIEIVDGRIARFETHMTGELRHLLLTRSILAPREEDASVKDEGAFRRGLAHGSLAESLPRLLFRARADHLFKELSGAAVASYVSGVLVAHELANALLRVPQDAAVTIVGAAGPAADYALGLTALKRRHGVIDGSVAAREGLLEIARVASIWEMP